eukprot:SAG11_NODE_2706_length_3071_cov_10.920929_1_plen_45_part_00
MLDTNNVHHSVQQEERIPKLIKKNPPLNFSTSEFSPVGQAIFKI